MHSAPSVAYPVRRSRAAGVYLLAATSLSITVTLVWVLQTPSGWPVWLGGFFCVLGCFWGGLVWRAMPNGSLTWDGEAWQLTLLNPLLSSDVALPRKQIAVMLDLQRHLLLQWPGSDPVRWLWIDQSSQPERWYALRRAVYSSVQYAGDSPVSGTTPAAP